MNDGPTPDFVIAAARLIDGHRDVPVLHDGAAAIAGARILAVGTRRELTERFPGAPVVDAPGASLLPGLIDCHVHLTMPGDGSTYEIGAGASRDQRHRRAADNARRHLLAGVTTVRDLGSHADLFDWRETSPAELPRLLLYGPPLTRPDGHMHLYGGTCSGAPEVEARARENLARGADGLKIVASGGGTLGTRPHEASFSTDELAAAAGVAHETGKVITAHALPIEAMQRSLDAGLDGIEHLGFLDGPGHSEFDEAVAARIVDQGVTLGSTVGVNARYVSLAEGDKVSDYELDEQRERTAYYVANAGRLHRMGARIVAASDSGWKYTRFGEFALELELLASAGISQCEVIHAATAGAAEALRVADVGRVAPGFEADLLLVAGDPLGSITALRDVRAVYRAGRRVSTQASA
jgi:imidazolonepropionase-like amidohydrolase